MHSGTITQIEGRTCDDHWLCQWDSEGAWAEEVRLSLITYELLMSFGVIELIYS